MDRRTFIRICSTSLATGMLSPCFSPILQAAELAKFERVKLVDSTGASLKAGQLGTAESYIFNYPYQGTPAFLINLGKAATGGVKLATANGEQYVWKGGVGAQQAIVAYVAICAHQLAYPNRELGIMSYNAGKSEIAGRGGVITCCAHNSVYDPATGAKVLSGPSEGPLAAIELMHDPESDELYATGVYGGQLFDEFFRAYKIQLNAELGPGKAKQPSSGTATAIPATAYSKQLLQC